jgi:hypothetical protein
MRASQRALVDGLEEGERLGVERVVHVALVLAELIRRLEDGELARHGLRAAVDAERVLVVGEADDVAPIELAPRVRVLRLESDVRGVGEELELVHVVSCSASLELLAYLRASAHA